MVILKDIRFFYINKILKFARSFFMSLKKNQNIIRAKTFKAACNEQTKLDRSIDLWWYRNNSTKPTAQPNCDRTHTNTNHDG